MARVLVVEDEPGVRDFVSRALSQQGHEVATAEDGFAALERLGAETFDLLLTDIAMPGIDGIALALKASKDWPDMAILMMTGFAHERQRARNLDALGETVVSKPFSLKEICDAVEATLRRTKR